jgi:hypothetical protein
MLPPQGAIRRWATLSDDGLYRYWLRRAWTDTRPTTTDAVLWIMLNPSKADAHEDDATIRRCIGFTDTWGHAALEVVNLFGYRSTDPAGLLAAKDPVGLENELHLRSALRRARVPGVPIVVAWGAGSPLLHSGAGLHVRVAGVKQLAQEEGVVLRSLGVNKDGSPRHPVRLAGSTLLHTWPRDV